MQTSRKKCAQQYFFYCHGDVQIIVQSSSFAWWLILQQWPKTFRNNHNSSNRCKPIMWEISRNYVKFSKMQNLSDICWSLWDNRICLLATTREPIALWCIFLVSLSAQRGFFSCFYGIPAIFWGLFTFCLRKFNKLGSRNLFYNFFTLV